MILDIINRTALNERKPRASGDDPAIRNGASLDYR